MAVTDWGGANSRFLVLVFVGVARLLDQTALRPFVIKGIRQIDVKYITHMQSVLAKWKCIQKRRPCKKMASVRSKMRDRSAQKDIYIYIYISSILKCSNDSSRLWWNWQFCKDLKIGVTPFPSIVLGRSGVKSVTVDFGTEIKSELSF